MSISTYDVLKSIGFKENTSTIDDHLEDLIIDFGNCKLSAMFGINRWLQETFSISGVMSTSRSIAYIDTEMPLEVDSREQGLAWVTWCLDKHADGGAFKPIQPMDWLIEGRQYFQLLPWELKRVEDVAKQALYAARPYCQVQRDWARVALRNLSEKIAILADEDSVIFKFDGEILTIRCMDSTLAMPAAGEVWPNRYLIKVQMLRKLPKRLMSEIIEFSVWNSVLKIGSSHYKDVIIVENMDEL